MPIRLRMRLKIVALVPIAVIAAACSFQGPSGTGTGNVDELDASSLVDAFQADADPSIPFLPGFNRRRLVRIDNGDGPMATGVVFPIPIGALEPDLMGEDGSDVCVTTFGNVVIPADVEFSEVEAIVWVAADISAGNETKLWVYYQSTNIGSGECEPGVARTNPFADYFGVFHFSDSWNSIDMSVRNSAGGPEFNNNENLSSMDENDVELANWATAVEFQNTEKFSTVVVEPIFRADPNETILFEVLFKSPSASSSRVLFDSDNEACRGMSLKLQPTDLNEGFLSGSLGIGNNCQGGLNDHRATSLARLDDNEWHHAAFEIERNGVESQLSLYVDGVFQESSGAFSDNASNSARPMQIGRDLSSNLQDYAGLLDEVRIGPPHSPEWINVSARLVLDRGLMMVRPLEMRQ